MKQNFVITLVSAFLVTSAASAVERFESLCADRTLVERVYYEHRTGQKAPFEQVLSDDAIRGLVRRDQQREVTLRKTYGVEITAARLDAEMKRIEAGTRVP